MRRLTFYLLIFLVILVAYITISHRRSTSDARPAHTSTSDARPAHTRESFTDPEDSTPTADTNPPAHPAPTSDNSSPPPADAHTGARPAHTPDDASPSSLALAELRAIRRDISSIKDRLFTSALPPATAPPPKLLPPPGFTPRPTEPFAPQPYDNTFLL